jgi:hypothetical protein
VPVSISVGDEEAGHVISKGTDNVIIELGEEMLVDKVVKGNVEASGAKDTSSASTFSTKGHTVDRVVLSIEVLVEAGGRRAIEDLEVLVGLRPLAIHTIDNSLTVKLVEALDGILGVDGIASRDEGAGELGHDFRTATVTKTILADSKTLFDTGEGGVKLHTLQALLEEGGPIVDGTNRVLPSRGSGGSLSDLVVFVEGGERTTHEEEGNSRRDIGSGDEPNQTSELEHEGRRGILATVGQVVEEIHGPTKETNRRGTFGPGLKGLQNSVVIDGQRQVVRSVELKRSSALELLTRELISDSSGAYRGAVRAENLGGGGRAIVTEELGSGVNVGSSTTSRGREVDPPQMKVVEDRRKVGLAGGRRPKVDRRNMKVSRDTEGRVNDDRVDTVSRGKASNGDEA